MTDNREGEAQEVEPRILTPFESLQAALSIARDEVDGFDEKFAEVFAQELWRGDSE